MAKQNNHSRVPGDQRQKTADTVSEITTKVMEKLKKGNFYTATEEIGRGYVENRNPKKQRVGEKKS